MGLEGGLAANQSLSSLLDEEEEGRCHGRLCGGCFTL